VYGSWVQARAVRAVSCFPASLVQNREQRIQRKNRGNRAHPPRRGRFFREFRASGDPLQPARRRAARRIPPVNLPPQALWIYAAASVVCFTAMAWDKLAAVRGARRVPERRLHALELAGGWPGALLAIAALRHKSSKPSFWALTLAAALLHVGLWAAWFASAH
jgi:uncharacterized membrane protein YsdA (DUF1294 family)